MRRGAPWDVVAAAAAAAAGLLVWRVALAQRDLRSMRCWLLSDSGPCQGEKNFRMRQEECSWLGWTG